MFAKTMQIKRNAFIKLNFPICKWVLKILKNKLIIFLVRKDRKKKERGRTRIW